MFESTAAPSFNSKPTSSCVIQYLILSHLQKAMLISQYSEISETNFSC